MKQRMHSFSRRLLRWYDENRINYPWRAGKDPYHVWLSEILLQQTRIPVATRYYQRIVSRYPTLADLAQADDQTFLAFWSGAGYYRRGVDMLACARKIMAEHQGKFPIEQTKLLDLPGIGPYTAGAIRNICHDVLTPAADGNIARVLSRISNIEETYGSRLFQQKVQTVFLELGHGFPAGDYFQALMELGERICLPRPTCVNCPVRRFCTAYRTGNAANLPRKSAKKTSQTFHWYFLVLRRKNGQSLFTRNRERQFLKDAWLFPDLLASQELSGATIGRHFSETWGVDLSNYEETIRTQHAVTFRKLFAHVMIQPANGKTTGIDGKWLTTEQLKAYPTSSIIFKIFALL